jgi:hypothetical protein
MLALGIALFVGQAIPGGTNAAELVQVAGPLRCGFGHVKRACFRVTPVEGWGACGESIAFNEKPELRTIASGKADLEPETV